MASRGDALVSWVEEVGDRDILVTAGQDRSQRRVKLDVGERVELVWKASVELRSMPAELVAAEDRGQPCWRLRPTGPATRGQRRAAVRGPLEFPVRAIAGNTELVGVTVDLSEGGFRGPFQPLVDEAGPVAVSEHNSAAGSAPPEEDAATASLFIVGAVLDVTVALQQEQARAKAEVIRRHEREDGRRELSVRFIGLPEYMQDVIRARVFAGLRDLRLRGLL